MKRWREGGTESTKSRRKRGEEGWGGGGRQRVGERIRWTVGTRSKLRDKILGLERER